MRFAILLTLLFTGCGGAEAPLTPPPPSAFSQADLVQGSGPAASRGSQLTVHYTGWLFDASKPDSKGKQFDSSVGSEPFTFRLGAGDVIRGWDQGFEGMRVKGRRRLIIPPDLGYGSMGTPDGTIPGNTGLVFEMELLDVTLKRRKRFARFNPRRPSAVLGGAAFSSMPSSRDGAVRADDSRFMRRRSARAGPRAAAAGVSRGGVRPIAFASPAHGCLSERAEIP